MKVSSLVMSVGVHSLSSLVMSTRSSREGQVDELLVGFVLN